MVHAAAALALAPRTRRFALVAVVLACFLGIAFGAVAGRPQDPAESLDRARDLVFAGKPEAALKEIRRALAILAEDGDPALRAKALARAAQIADFHLPDSHLPEALGYYRELVRAYPTSPEAFDAGIRVAEILRQRLHDDEHAEAQFVAVVNAFPRQAGVERLLLRAGQIALENRRYDAARTDATRLLEGWPQSDLGAEAETLLGRAYQQEGRLPEATRAYEAVAERWPGTEAAARALYEAGNCLVDQADYGHAIARYIEALPVHPDPMTVQKGLERARRHFSALRAMEPGSKAYAFARASAR